MAELPFLHSLTSRSRFHCTSCRASWRSTLVIRQETCCNVVMLRRTGEHTTDTTCPKRFRRCSSLTRTNRTSLLRCNDRCQGNRKYMEPGEVAQVQHIDRIVVLTVCGNTKYEPSRQCRRRKKLLWFGFTFLKLDIPVDIQRHVTMFQKVQESIVLPQDCLSWTVLVR